MPSRGNVASFDATSPLYIMIQTLENGSIYIGKKLVLSKLNLQITPASFIHIKGPNGSGKTVLMQALLGFYTVEGNHTRFAKSPSIVYIPDHPFFDENTQIKQIYQAYQFFYNTPLDKLHAVVELLNIQESRSQRVSTLSLGTQKKLQIMPLFLNPCDIYILDEITLSLDAQTIEHITSRIIELHHLHKTILISEHNQDVIHTLSKHIKMKEFLCENNTISTI